MISGDKIDIMGALPAEPEKEIRKLLYGEAFSLFPVRDQMILTVDTVQGTA